MKIATYMPSANSEPCARLIVSITPTISMKPSAISANSRPSEMPFSRCGSNCSTAFIAMTDLLLVARRRRHRLELAGARRVLVNDVGRLGLREDLVDVVLLRRRVVVRRHV